MITHGLSKSPEYKAWKNMRDRCRNPENPGFKNYGGRGILVCPRWISFDDFYLDMGRRPSGRHSIDRINFNGPYSPTNCRWALPVEQSNNSRKNRFLTSNGITLSVSAWARRLGIKRSTLSQRLRYGWAVRRALTG